MSETWLRGLLSHWAKLSAWANRLGGQGFVAQAVERGSLDSGRGGTSKSPSHTNAQPVREAKGALRSLLLSGSLLPISTKFLKRFVDSHTHELLDLEDIALGGDL